MRRLLCILLTVAMLTLCIPAVFASENPEEETQTATFHAPTVQKMIEANLALGNADEAFFHTLANAYLADPALLVEIIQELPEDDILYLAKAISYDLQKTGRVSQASIPAECDTPLTNAIAKLIYGQAGLTANATLDAFYSAELQESQILANATNTENETWVSKPTLTVDQAEIYTTATATFTVSKQSPVTSNTTVSFAVYRKNGTAETMIGRGTATIPANSHSVQVNYSFTNNTLGIYRIYVKVFLPLTNSEMSDTAFVTGTWHITVELTEDRTELGTITLFNGEGTQVSSSICLGRSESGDPMNVYLGNTPIGVYDAVLAEHNQDENKYGPYKVIMLTPTDGYMYDHCQNRDGIWIHGGRTSYNSDPDNPLCVTNGCVRVLTAYQLTLETEITALENNYHYNVGVVTITQNGQIDL